MDLQQIERFLEINEWKKVDNTNDFICRSDINLRLKRHKTSLIARNALPSNLNLFLEGIDEQLTISYIQSFIVDFYYNANLLQSVVVFQFCGTTKGQHSQSRIVNYAKELDIGENDKVSDKFYIALNEFLNDANGKHIIEQAVQSIPSK